MQHFFPRFGLWEPWEALAGRLVLGGDVVDQVFDAVEGAATAGLGTSYIRCRHDAGVRVPADAPDGDPGRGGRLDGGGLGSGPLPRVARAPSAGGTPAFSRGR